MTFLFSTDRLRPRPLSESLANASPFRLCFPDYSEPSMIDKRTLFSRIKEVFGRQIMENRISRIENEGREREDRREPQPIGAILAELLAQYQARFPKIHITVIETPAGAV